jgi:hypothetical protein
MDHLKITKGLTWPFLALALATTLIYMAGLAALQVWCCTADIIHTALRSLYGMQCCIRHSGTGGYLLSSM